MRKIIVILVISVLLLVGATGLAANYHQLSTVAFLNKVAIKLSLVQPYSPLIALPQRYKDIAVSWPQNLAFPRIIFTKLRHWNGLTTPEFYSQRLINIKQQRLGFRSKCPQKKLAGAVHCFLEQPSLTNLRDLEQRLNKYRLTNPKALSDYGNAWRFVLLYDIAKAAPNFSSSITVEIENKLAQMLEKYLQLLDQESASLWHGRSNLAATAFLIASVLETNTVNHQALYARAYGHFADFYRAIAATETWPEGYNYWINNRALPVILALSAFKNHQSEPAMAQQVLNTIKRIGLWHIYLTRSDFKIEGWGDEGPRIDLKDETAKVIDAIAQITDDVVFYEFAQRIRLKHKTASYYGGHRWLLPFLYANSFINSPLLSNNKLSFTDIELPTSELFGANYTNHLSIRSDWSPEATFITFRAGHSFTHHQNYDAGHFTIFKGVPLAVNASRYNGAVSSGNRKYFGVRTVAKNSLLIQKADEEVKPNHLFDLNVADGGQRLVMPTGSAITGFEHWQQLLNQKQHVEGAKLSRYQFQPNVFTAITADLTASYNSNRFDDNGGKGKVKRVERTLVYVMAQNLMLVYDSLTTTDSAYKTKWLLHTINRPLFDQMLLLKGTRDNGILTTASTHTKIVNGDSSLDLDILLPKQSQTGVIGGPDYRFYVEVDGDDSELDGQNFTQGAKEARWYDLPQWRLEISPLEQATQTHYLIALQPRITADNMAAIAPIKLDSATVSATVFDNLLVLASFKSAQSQFELEQAVDTLGLFTDKTSVLALKNHKN
ncbi:MAG: hypothetical protein HRU22_05565 [Gammaproteobacteria bacterium]|nr:hypothetical protein [Gammaproteobacteria bacterium]